MKLWLKAALITLLALMLSTVLMSPFSASMNALFAAPEKNDFTMTDFYNLIADGRQVSYTDDNIVIVNLDQSDRDEIAWILDVVTLSGARAVGLDVTFETPRPGDSLLLASLDRTPNLVQPLTMRPVDDSEDVRFGIVGCSYFYAPGDAGYASSAMPSKFANSTIREFRTHFRTDSIGTVDGFALALARIADPEAARRLEARGNDLEVINYHSRRFHTFEPDELIDHADMLNGKIVLLGALTERGDLHPTPVNSLMPGIMVHANALATVLDGAYMHPVPKWISMAVAFLICYIIVIMSIGITNRIKGLMMRIVQITLLLALVQVGYLLFVLKGIIFDFSTALMMLAFGFFAIDIWNGFTEIIVQTPGAIRRLRGKLARLSARTT